MLCDFLLVALPQMSLRRFARASKMKIQKKIWTSRYNEIGSGPPKKSKVIWVSIRINKQLDPHPPMEKVGPSPGTSENDSFL